MDHTTSPRTIILYTSQGDWGAFLVYPFLYNTQGEWIGWATPEKEVFNLEGRYVGRITSDNRIVRQRVPQSIPPNRPPPRSAPKKARLPSSIPLPPPMGGIAYDHIDILQEKPELLHTLDSGEFRPDAE